jgi:hypothetical protein
MVGMGMVATTIIIESRGFALAARSM